MTKRLFLTACLSLFCLTAAASAQRVEFILDGSGSMWGEAGGEAKIVAAKRAMVDLLSAIELPPSATLGLTVYGHRAKGDCADIEHFPPVGYAERSQLVPLIEGIQPKGKTPIADSLRIVGDALKGKEESSSIVLVSDGIESCDKDPCEVARQLREEYGINVVIHVVGFDVREGQEQLQCIAEAGGGEFRSAGNSAELAKALGDIGTAVQEDAKPRLVTMKGSPLSAIVVEPLTLEGFPKIDRLYILKAGSGTNYHSLHSGGAGTTKIGEPIFVQPGEYLIAYRPSQGGGQRNATVLLGNLEVEPRQTKTIHTNRVVAGIMVKQMEDLPAKGFWVVEHGGSRDKWRIETHGYHVATTNGYEKVMVVPAGGTYDVLIDVGQDPMPPIQEKVSPQPGELLVIGGEG